MRVYRDVLRTPGVLSVTASQLFARLPLGMLNLAILLHVQSKSGSYALAGAAVACVSVGEALAMPVTARLAGRAMTATLVVAALANGAAMLALAFAGASSALLLTLGVVVGASVPPLMPVVRALYPQLVPPGGVRALFAFDTTVQELIWVVGPVAATFLASALSTGIPLVASAVVTVVGTGWFLLSARHLRPDAPKDAGAFGRVMANRAVILAMVASLALVASFMALEVGIVAALGRTGVTAGLAIAVASVGSLVGGLVFGHRRFGLAGLVAALGTVAIGTGVFGIVDNLVLEFAALFVSGLGFAPAMSALYLMVSREIAEHSATEAFGWLNSASLVGGAIGTAIAGVAVEAHGVTGPVVVSTVLATLAACTPIVARMGGPLTGLIDQPHARTDPGVAADGRPTASKSTVKTTSVSPVNASERV
ncbi:MULTISPECIES: MFS transporter [unclassified Mycolicibacterium]|uniref:MFS transporter n=1 Tax=unclassified Mycolicibacterium TaxID=2636767 RepID=UPI0012DE8356|nr:MULTISPECIES: MFS transporter [unclassified Mycolicibacterium]MUL81429.1 MFS transporter [Mycolicibacterium sp. CBMA 329]MUL87195.1 MFS transporter [Mycolicibacterium sp. CBMA 331]MUL98523.1 MFS transporter [Mycolicibacterium sp. CBMA 334]MUM29597.1 MFS transporter [Mycolicibacterium sp. CBMA 295]MUM37492.1 MFS transporter [Mycolicibacterium sp. CBMA 247]